MTREEEFQKQIEEEDQLLREIIRASATRPLDRDERAALLFHTGVRDEQVR